MILEKANTEILLKGKVRSVGQWWNDLRESKHSDFIVR